MGGRWEIISPLPSLALCCDSMKTASYAGYSGHIHHSSYWYDVLHQSVMSKPCLLCSSRIWFAFEYIFEIYLDTLAWISFAKFEINFRNPLIGCQCFDFVCPKARSVHPNWCTRSNFVRPESRSVRPGRNDMLWIQRWVYNKDHNECTADHKYK